jgi:hypothetical protein
MATQTIGGYAVGTVMPSGHVVGGTSASAKAQDAQYASYGIPTSSTATAPISSTTLTPTTQPTIPTATTIPTSQTTGVVTANNQALTPSGFTTDSNGIYTPKEQAVVDSQTKLANDRINALMNNPQPNLENLYNTTRQQTGVDQAQQAVNTYTGQLNTITANSQAAQLAANVQGSNTGATETIVGGRQAEIAKEAAINALPIQALLATAQGNLQMAQSNLDTLFSIKSKDAENTYSFNTSMINAVYDFADKQQQNLLDTLKTQQAQAYATQQDFLKTQSQLLQSAVSQGASGAVVSAINNATDMNSAIKAAGQYSGDVLGQQLKQLQVNAILNPQGNLNRTLTLDEAAKYGVPVGTKLSDLQGITLGNGLDPKVVEQNNLDTQTVNSAYSRIQAILSNYKLTPATVTQSDIGKLSDEDQAAIAQQTARMVKPDLARSGGDPTLSLNSPSFIATSARFVGTALGLTRKYSPKQVMDTISLANSIYNNPIGSANTVTVPMTVATDPLGVFGVTK